MATTTSTPAPDRTLLVGGSILVAAAVGPLALQQLTAFLPGSGVVWAVAYAAGLLVLARGLPGEAGITGDRRAGSAALLALGVLTVVRSLVPLVVSVEPVDAATWITVGVVDAVLTLIVASVAAVEIQRARVIPAPWHLAPLWGVAVITLTWVSQAALAAVAASGDPTGAAMGSALLGTLNTLVTVALGVAAVALSGRAREGRGGEDGVGRDRALEDRARGDRLGGPAEAPRAATRA